MTIAGRLGDVVSTVRDPDGNLVAIANELP
jgi:hypothetical protein